MSDMVKCSIIDDMFLDKLYHIEADLVWEVNRHLPDLDRVFGRDRRCIEGTLTLMQGYLLAKAMGESIRTLNTLLFKLRNNKVDNGAMQDFIESQALRLEGAARYMLEPDK